VRSHKASADGKDRERMGTYKLYQPEANALREAVLLVLATSDDERRRPTTPARALAAADTRKIMAIKLLLGSQHLGCVLDHGKTPTDPPKRPPSSPRNEKRREEM